MKFIILLRQASPKVFFYAIVVSALSGFFSTYVIGLIRLFVAEGLDNEPYFAVKFLSSVVLFGVTAVLSSYFVSILTQSMVMRLRTDLSSKILSASYQKTERNLDKILPILTSDIFYVSASMNRLPPVVTGLATALGCIGYLFFLSWKLTLGSMVLFIMVGGINYMVLPYLKRYSELAREVLDKIHKNFEGVTYGMKELKLNREHRLNFIEANVKPNCLEENKYRIKEETFYAASSRIVEMILLMSIGLFIINMGYLPWVDREMFGAYLLVFLLTVAPLATVSGFFKHLKRIQILLKKIDELGINLEEEEEPDFEHQDLDISGWNEKEQPIFSLKDIYFSYDANEDNEKFGIGPINFEVKKGEIIYLIGGNGTGKTTFIKMLTGLYIPTKGTLKFKNVNIEESKMDQYRKHFAGVFTDYYLFDDLHHIEESVIDREAQNLLKELEIDHKVEIIDKKLSTTRLSYGQRKRLAMLVSILEDKEVYIFDEWAANQDPYFKEIFYAKILPELKKKGKTIVAISHDEKYFSYADRIVKMAEGQISEVQKP